jgi:hypothetical protein
MQAGSNRNFSLQNECTLHYHATDSVLIFMSQHIWIKINIVLGILIIIEKFHTGKSCMRIRISGQQIHNFKMLSSGRVTCCGRWGGWRVKWMWSWLWSPHPASGGVAEIPDQEIAPCSFRRKRPKWMFRFEERREGVAAAR